MWWDFLLLQLYYAPRRVHPFYDHGAVRPILPVCRVVPPRIAYSTPILQICAAGLRNREVKVPVTSDAVCASEFYLVSLFSTCSNYDSASPSKRYWCHLCVLAIHFGCCHHPRPSRSLTLGSKKFKVQLSCKALKVSMKDGVTSEQRGWCMIGKWWRCSVPRRNRLFPKRHCW